MSLNYAIRDQANMP